jgi:hypothetical protein
MKQSFQCSEANTSRITAPASNAAIEHDAAIALTPGFEI